MKKDTYYFSHDCNARKDEKILTLLVDHGYEGYGIYWALIEMMFENADTAISRNLLKGIAYDLRMDIKVLNSVITTCYNTKLFQADKDKIWSNSLRRRKAEWLESRKKKSEAGKRGMAARWGYDNTVTESDNTVITQKNSVITDYNKGKESKVNKRKGKESIYGDKPQQQKFIKPTVEDLENYFLEITGSEQFKKQLSKTFLDHYESNGWKVGRNKMVDWKASARKSLDWDKNKNLINGSHKQSPNGSKQTGNDDLLSRTKAILAAGGTTNN